MLICFPLSRSLYLLRISHVKNCKFLKRERKSGKEEKKDFMKIFFMNGGERNEEKKLINIRFLLLPFLYHLITWISWCSKNKIEMHFSFVLEFPHTSQKCYFTSKRTTDAFNQLANLEFIRLFFLVCKFLFGFNYLAIEN